MSIKEKNGIKRAHRTIDRESYGGKERKRGRDGTEIQKRKNIMRAHLYTHSETHTATETLTKPREEKKKGKRNNNIRRSF